MTAYLLQQRTPSPLEISLFEASDRLGGKVVTRQFSSAPVSYEAGAAELYDYSEAGPDPLREMVRSFGLTTRPMEGKAIVLGDQFLHDAEDMRLKLRPAHGQRRRRLHPPRVPGDQSQRLLRIRLARGQQRSAGEAEAF